MAYSESYLSYVLDQLSSWRGVSSRKMFGGVGLYKEGKMFGLIAGDQLFFKVDETNKDSYIEAGSQPFKPYADKATTMSYYEIPIDILEQPEELVLWAEKSLEIQKTKS